MQFLELELFDVRHSLESSEAFVMLLKEKGANRVIPVVIGFTEAKAIIMLMNKVRARRPSTYELLQSIIEKLNATVDKVIIYHFDAGVFFSRIYLKKDKEEIVLDSRTSDAIAIALLFNSFIYIEKNIFEKLAYATTTKKTDKSLFSDDGFQDEELFIEEKIKEMTILELEDLLKGAIESEDFELATKIHGELSTRKKHLH